MESTSMRAWASALAVALLAACPDGGGGGGADAGPDAATGGADATPYDPSNDVAHLNGVLASHGLVHRTIFSVAPGAVGAPGSGVASVAPDAQSHLFVSARKGPSHVLGDNQVLAVPDDLDLLATDDLSSVSTLHRADSLSPWYFSVVDRAGADEGQATTAVRAEATDGEVPGDVFYAVGAGAKGFPGQNFLFTDELRLALEPQAAGGTPKDDLDALDFAYGATVGTLFFTVGRGSAGIETVAGVAAGERSCTIFRTELGTKLVEVAFTCAQLGLQAGDHVDGLHVRGSGQVSEILFSVDAASQGAPGSAVAAEVAGDVAEADLFRSTGTGTNTLVHQEVQLGLLDGASPDELDALTRADLTLEGYLTRLPPPPEEPPPVTPPPGADPGDSEAWLPAWELALLGGARIAVAYAPGETVAHPCTSCGIAPKVPEDEGALVDMSSHLVPMPQVRVLFSLDGPFANADRGLTPEIALSGQCRVASPSCAPGNACKRLVVRQRSKKPRKPRPGRKQERACKVAQRETRYGSPQFPKDLFTGGSHVIVDRLLGGTPQVETLSVGAPAATDITQVPVSGCIISVNGDGPGVASPIGGQGGAIMIFDAEQLETINDPALRAQPIGLDAPTGPPVACFLFTAPESDPFGINTGDFSLTTAPKGDDYFDDTRSLADTICAIGGFSPPTGPIPGGDGGAITLFGEDGTPTTLGLDSPLVDKTGCPP